MVKISNIKNITVLIKLVLLPGIAVFSNDDLQLICQSIECYYIVKRKNCITEKFNCFSFKNLFLKKFLKRIHFSFQIVDEAKRSMHDALCVVRNLVRISFNLFFLTILVILLNCLMYWHFPKLKLLKLYTCLHFKSIPFWIKDLAGK